MVKKNDFVALSELYQKPEYVYYEIYKDFETDIKEIRDEMKEIEDPEAYDKLEQTQIKLMKEFLKAIEGKLPTHAKRWDGL